MATVLFALALLVHGTSTLLYAETRELTWQDRRLIAAGGGYRGPWHLFWIFGHPDEGRFYLPDAEEGKRETIVTAAIDAQPMQCLRVPGPTWLTFIAAVLTRGFFIFSTSHCWWTAAISGVLALGIILI